MKSIFTAFILAGVFAFAGTTKDQFKLINSAQLKDLMKNKTAHVYIYDANNEKTRTTEGLIPGAKQLPSSEKYDVALLPDPKKEDNATLVFYCANTKCSASHDAANFAATKGFKNVLVMSDGIQGWKKAGNLSIPYKKSMN